MNTVNQEKKKRSNSVCWGTFCGGSNELEANFETSQEVHKRGGLRINQKITRKSNNTETSIIILLVSVVIIFVFGLLQKVPWLTGMFDVFFAKFNLMCLFLYKQYRILWRHSGNATTRIGNGKEDCTKYLIIILSYLKVDSHADDNNRVQVV